MLYIASYQKLHLSTDSSESFSSSQTHPTIDIPLQQSKKQNQFKDKMIRKFKRKNQKQTRPQCQNIGHKKRGPKTFIWTTDDRKLFCMYVVQQVLRDSLHNLSWTRIKPQHFFVRQASYIQTKTVKQCKSYDQRHNIENTLKDGKIDIVQAYLKILVEEYIIRQRHDDVVKLIHRYKAQRLVRKVIKIKNKYVQSIDITSSIEYII